MRKYLLVLALAAIACVCGFAACGKNHEHVLDYHTATAATCASEGTVEHWSCEGCGKLFSDAEGTAVIKTAEITVLEHRYGAWSESDATCTAAGVKERTCLDCGEKEKTTIPALGHNLTQHSAKAATCTEVGWAAYETCGRCDYSSKAEIPALGHDFSHWSSDELSHWKSCALCGERDGNAAAAHQITDDNCVVCGYASVLTFALIDGGAAYSVTSAQPNVTQIVIPSYYKGLPVRTIYYDAFKDCSKLTTVTIPSSVTEICDSAFEGCVRLKNVTLSEGLKIIGRKAFLGCSELTNIVIPNGAVNIVDSAFDKCINLTNVSIPDSVTFVGYNAFLSCDNLVYNEYDNAYYLGNAQNPYVVLIKIKDTSVTSCEISERAKLIYCFAFNLCNNIEEIAIGDSVTTLSSSALRGCGGLKRLTIGSGVTFIGEYAFNGCDILEQITVDPRNKTFHVDNNCLIETAEKVLVRGVASSVIPSDGSVTSIGGTAFYKYAQLTDIVIPDEIKSIGETAFLGCVNMTSITIGSGVTFIDDKAFDNCGKLNRVYYNGSLEDWNRIDISQYNSALTSAARYYYSESEPTVSGNYWHYVSGVPTAW